MVKSGEIDTVYEVSYEAGNRIGGIHTVLSSKAKYMKETYGKNYLVIGFYNKKRSHIEIIEKKPSKEMEKIFKELKKDGIRCIYGVWADADDVPIILIDPILFQRDNIDKINTILWEKYKIDSLNTWNDYREPVAWSYAAGKLIEKLAKKNKNAVAQFHEWLSGAAILYLKMKKVEIPTVFTTHATTLGRTMASKGDLSFISGKIDPDKKAYEFGVAAKHQMEKSAAHHSDVFTTVSDNMGEEVFRVLGKKSDKITINAIDFIGMPPQNELSVQKAKYRSRMDEFLMAYFSPYYPIEIKNSPVFFTAGRYEFENKGYDLFIDSLGELNRRLEGSKKTIIAFIWVPRGTIAPKDEIVKNFLTYDRLGDLIDSDCEEIKESIMLKLSKGESITKSDIVSNKILADVRTSFDRIRSRRGLNPPLNAFKLSSREEDDQILKKIRENKLENKETDNVKIIFYPVYLNREDELLGLDYKEALIASNLGVMLSRYEPWGYMGHETAAYGNVSITTDMTGFGRFVKNNYKMDKILSPVEVVDAKDKKREDVVKRVADIMETYVRMKKNDRKKIEMGAYEVAKKACWEEQIKNYIDAYSLAVKKFNSHV